MLLHKIKPAPGSRPAKVIVGRGEGSTLGQTAGKGQKGQTSRSGDTIMVGFEGGQTPLVRRIPKRGFNHPSKIYYTPINLFVLEQAFKSGQDVNGEALYKLGLISTAKSPFKILGDGKITKSFKIRAPKFSKSAEKAITAAGGTITSAK